MYKSFNVRTLGILEIGHLKNVFPERGKRSTQVELLIIYLIMNRDRNITASQLITYLWEDKENQVTIGALRNLVYRARKDLKNLYGKEACILSKGHSYYWNPAIKCTVDYEELTKVVETIINGEATDLYLSGIQLAKMYENEFLPEFQDNSWIKMQSEKLNKLVYVALYKVCNKLQEGQEYEKLLEILELDNIAKLEDDQLFEARLNCKYHLGAYDEVIRYYQDIVDHYYSYHDSKIPVTIEEIYQRCLNSQPELEIKTITLEEFLETAGNVKGAFYCDFAIFKRIYQLNLVDVSKAGNEHALVMITIKDKEGHYDNQEIQKESKRLKDLMQTNLRKSDIFSQYSLTQYFMLIHAPKLSGIESAVNRIINYFNDEKQNDSIYLENKIEKVTF